MKKLLSLVIISCGIVMAYSCKKNSDLSSGERLIGTWTLSEIGSDNNNNKRVDTEEIFPPDPSNTAGTITFRGDNTYTNIYKSGGIGGIDKNESGTWTYSNNSINLVTPSGTDRMPVHSVSNNKLVVKVVNNWSIYLK